MTEDLLIEIEDCKRLAEDKQLIEDLTGAEVITMPKGYGPVFVLMSGVAPVAIGDLIYFDCVWTSVPAELPIDIDSFKKGLRIAGSLIMSCLYNVYLSCEDGLWVATIRTHMGIKTINMAYDKETVFLPKEQFRKLSK